MANLSLKNISKIYPNGVKAVSDFSLDIKDGEFITFVGPSGCGKSTTLRMIAGLENITAGELYIDNKLVNNVEPKDREIAMVFQSYALYPHMTTYQNIQFALRLRKFPMPLYEENEEINRLKEKVKALYQEIRNNDKKLKKNQNDNSYVEEHKKLYQELYALNEQIHALEKPVMGIDQTGIRHLTQEINRLKSKRIRDGKTLKEAEAYLEKLKAEKESAAASGSSLKKYDKELPVMENAVAIYASAVRQEEKQTADDQNRLAFLQANPVPLYRNRHMTYQEMDIEVNKAMEALDLTKYLFRKPNALSGGQRQRVALGRCIVRKPKVFLMDEPLSNLDAKLRVQTRTEILRIHHRIGATTIYVTHDQTEAMTMADRIVVMKNGLVQQIGTPEEIYHDPSNRFVAGFIGSPAMNFMTLHYRKGKLYPKEDKTKAVDASIYQDLLKDYEDKDVVLGIRPEDIKKVNKATSKSYPVTCRLYELLGYEAMVYTELFSSRIILKIPSERVMEEGEEFFITLDTNKLYFFRTEDGNRIK